jgi:hypothetical protein
MACSYKSLNHHPFTSSLWHIQHFAPILPETMVASKNPSEIVSFRLWRGTGPSRQSQRPQFLPHRFDVHNKSLSRPLPESRQIAPVRSQLRCEISFANSLHVGLSFSTYNWFARDGLHIEWPSSKGDEMITFSGKLRIS